MVKAGPPAVGGGGSGGGGSRNKCPLCRVEFSEADVVGGAELEKAGGNAKEPGLEGEGGAAGLASAAVVGEEEGGKGGKVPPPKVAALLQR